MPVTARGGQNEVNLVLLEGASAGHDVVLAPRVGSRRRFLGAISLEPLDRVPESNLEILGSSIGELDGKARFVNLPRGRYRARLLQQGKRGDRVVGTAEVLVPDQDADLEVSFR
jgi:hypothetical protein